MTDIMLDLETLSVRPHAAVIIIGAIKFNRGEIWKVDITEEELYKKNVFYRRITIDSCDKIKLHIDNNTVKWWEEQETSVRIEALEHKDRTTINQALQDFKDWFGTNNRVRIWGNGSGFDCSILGESFTRCNIEKPWKFWMERDLRTIMDLAKVYPSNLPKYKQHHALWDCYRQIIAFQICESKLGI